MKEIEKAIPKMEYPLSNDDWVCVSYVIQAEIEGYRKSWFNRYKRVHYGLGNFRVEDDRLNYQFVCKFGNLEHKINANISLIKKHMANKLKANNNALWVRETEEYMWAKFTDTPKITARVDDLEIRLAKHVKVSELEKVADAEQYVEIMESVKKC